MAKRSHPITRYRESHGLTKEALSRAASISWRHLHRIERGEQPVTAKVARKLETATDGGLTAVELLGLKAA